MAQPEQQTSWLVRLREFAKRPRIQRLQQKKRAPWILRHCPESLSNILPTVFIFLGLFSQIIFLLAALSAFICVPLLLARNEWHSLVNILTRGYIQWFHRHFSPQNFAPAYLIIQTCIFGILSYFIQVSSWIIRSKRDEKLKREILNTSSKMPQDDNIAATET